MLWKRNWITWGGGLVSRDTLISILTPLLSELGEKDLAGVLTNRVSAVGDYLGLLAGKNMGQKISLNFNPHRLSVVAGSSRGSIVSELKNPSFISGLARAMLWKSGKVKELLYQVIQSGVNGVQYVNEFPPHVARNLLQQYGIERGHYVLDPCAGWGGRMIGVSTVCDNYLGFEPSQKTYAGLLELSTFLASLQKEFRGAVCNLPFEDSELPEATFDFALTSPPYFDTEKYDDRDTNSAVRYPTYDLWCEGFFFPLVEKTMRTLKPGSVFILNIADRRYPLSGAILRKFKNVFEIHNLGNFLSGKGGMGKEESSGECFYEIKHKVT